MAKNANADTWQVVEREGHVKLKTSRIGLVGRIDATAPIVGGHATWAPEQVSLTLKLAINEVKAGNALLDTAARRLVSSGSDGVLTFEGEGPAADGPVTITGRAGAGDVNVDMVVTCEPPTDVDADTRNLEISGVATFDDVKIPLPGFGKVNSIDIEVVGVLRLDR